VNIKRRLVGKPEEDERVEYVSWYTSIKGLDCDPVHPSKLAMASIFSLSWSLIWSGTLGWRMYDEGRGIAENTMHFHERSFVCLSTSMGGRRKHPPTTLKPGL
jgi:hypothetical protein